jgi:hypothetical protein
VGRPETGYTSQVGDDDAEENRRAILARRARFITAAIAGLSLSAGCPDPEPRPCLDAPPPGTGGGDVGGGNGDGGNGGVGGEGGIGGRGEGGGET